MPAANASIESRSDESGGLEPLIQPAAARPNAGRILIVSICDLGITGHFWWISGEGS
jgi:hypothetical protein